MTAKNRGTRNFKARLTEEQVKSIYTMRGKKTQQRLADQYHVSKSTIACIQTGRSWAWFTVHLRNL